jgi:hypothetical protein
MHFVTQQQQPHGSSALPERTASQAAPGSRAHESRTDCSGGSVAKPLRKRDSPASASS